MIRASSIRVGLLLTLCAAPTVTLGAENLVDLAGTVTPLVMPVAKPLEGNNFNNEARYEVRLRNNSGEAIPTHSLMIVLDRISNLAGEDRDPLKGDELINRIEVMDRDGTTADGRAFFRLPASQGPQLLPRSTSEPVLIRFRNPELTPAFPPSFRILGERRPGASASLESLIQLLIDKGVLTRDEWESALMRSNQKR